MKSFTKMNRLVMKVTSEVLNLKDMVLSEGPTNFTTDTTKTS